MKVIDLNLTFKNLSGDEISGAHAGKILAERLAEDTGTNPLKYFSWATELYTKGTLNLDPQDIELIRSFVTNSQKLTALAKAQILEKL